MGKKLLTPSLYKQLSWRLWRQGNAIQEGQVEHKRLHLDWWHHEEWVKLIDLGIPKNIREDDQFGTTSQYELESRKWHCHKGRGDGAVPRKAFMTSTKMLERYPQLKKRFRVSDANLMRGTTHDLKKLKQFLLKKRERIVFKMKKEGTSCRKAGEDKDILIKDSK